MSQDRNMKWLNNRKIKYRQDPINDNPTEETALYSYYENGTYECYHLFRSKAKITTYKSLKPPINKIRKIIFKDYSGLTPNEKMSIVGKLIGRSSRVDKEAIYQCMLDINDLGKNITWHKVASLLDCSTRTIQRNLTQQLKNEKQILNMEHEKI